MLSPYYNMDIFLISLGAILVILGIIGSVLPIIPGPPIAFVGMLIAHFSSEQSFSVEMLILFGGLARHLTIYLGRHLPQDVGCRYHFDHHSHGLRLFLRSLGLVHWQVVSSKINKIKFQSR